MAQLVLGVAGAAVGSFFGSPQIGWMVGVTLGGVLGQKKTHTEGPRLTDLSVQSSTYGGMVPIVFGAMRVAGNVIFCTDKREVSATTRNRGKGGASSSSTTYSYNVDMAVALCANQIAGIRKMWVNGKLKLDASANTSIESQIASTINAAGVKVYYGTDGQMPDATMEATLGAGNVPAYRGTAYIMFTALDCPGGVIPQLTFEVCTTGTDGGNINPVNLLDMGPGSETVYYGEYPVGAFHAVNKNVAGLDATGSTWILSGMEYPEPTVGGGVFLSTTWNNPSGFSHSVLWTPCEAKHGVSGDFSIEFMWNSGPADNDGAVSFAGPMYLASCSNALGGAVLGSWSFNLGSGVITFGLYKGGGAGSSVGPTPPLSPQTWYKIRASRVAGYMALFLNDVQAGASAYNPQALTSDTSLRITLGGEHGGQRYDPIYSGGYFKAFRFVSGSGFAIGADPTVGSVISDICQRAGLAAGSIDVTGLTETLRGYALTNVSSARANLEPLLKAFFIDVVESDGKLKFRKRSGITSSASIPLEDLGASENDTGDADVMPLRRTQEAEMPRSVSVSFINQNSDYQPGTEVSRRIVTASINDVTTDLPMAVDAVRAATVADALLFDAWTERNKRSFKVSRKYAALDAGDVVSIEHPAGTWTAKRITRAVDAGAVIECDAVDSDASVYTVVPVGATPAIPQAGVIYPFMTLLEPLNIPILADADDSLGMYVALGSNASGWPGASLYLGADDSTLEERGGVGAGAVIGVARSALGAWTSLLFDEKNTVDVLVYSGTLANATRDAVLDAGANMAMLGTEVIQFRTATLLSAGVYRLSGLLRGVRGTEDHTGGHALNDRFVLLDRSGLLRVSFDLSQLNVTRTFRGVTVGQPISSSAAVLDVCDADGAMPFAPVNLRRSTASNNITLTWDRRTRSLSTFPANGLDVPLFEAAENYSVDVYATSGFTTVVRTLTSTTPTITYTSAQQTTDGLTPGAVVNVRVYQVGAAGRRNYLQGTL